MILKTTAIALRRHPYTETSMVVSWLTPDAGRIHTLLKGAFRPKSSFLGAVDLFYTCEVLYYAKHPDDLSIAREIAPIDPRTALRTDWRACAAASYLCALISRVIPRGTSRPDLFGWLERALNDLAARSATVPRLCALELRLARLLGQAPRLEHCLGCHAALPVRGSVDFSPADGGWRCPSCAARTKRPHRSPVPASALRALLSWDQRSDSELGPLSSSIIDSAERAVGAFLAFHLDCPTAARTAALDILRRQPTPPIDPVRAVR